MTNEEILNIAIDEAYQYYESDHSLRSVMFIHPMFYNGTFSADNSYQPEEPEPIRYNRVQFEEHLYDIGNERWKTAVQVLFNYLKKHNQ